MKDLLYPDGTPVMLGDLVCHSWSYLEKKEGYGIVCAIEPTSEVVAGYLGPHRCAIIFMPALEHKIVRRFGLNIKKVG